MNGTAWTYLAYLALTVGITIWVARTLRRHGLVFLTRANSEVADDVALADALSHLLIVGFYLVNLGVISFLMQTDRGIVNAQQAIELLSSKVGAILVVLGVMHFVILTILASVRASALAEALPRTTGLSVQGLNARRRAGWPAPIADKSADSATTGD